MASYLSPEWSFFFLLCSRLFVGRCCSVAACLVHLMDRAGCFVDPASAHGPHERRLEQLERRRRSRHVRRPIQVDAVAPAMDRWCHRRRFLLERPA